MSAAPLGGRFVLEPEVAGAGGGRVYRARDLQTGLPVAIKVGPGHGPEAERFTRGATLLARLCHPTIACHVAHGLLAGGGQYLATEWVEGPDLGARLRAGALSVGDVLALGVRVATALGEAHRHGVLHRGLKPSNVLLEGGAAGLARLTDVAVARDPVSVTLARTLALATPGYLSPEQACGLDLDPRSDLFSLGLLLYETLAGRPAFTSDHLLGLLAKIAACEPAPLLELRPDAPPALLDLVVRLLAKEPGERPQGAVAAARELERIGAGVAGVAGPPLLAEELRVVSVVLAGPGAGQAAEAAVIAAAGARPARVVVLADGSVLVLLSGADAPIEQAERSARFAGELARLLPGRALVVATGRAYAAGPGAPPRVPVGELIDAAAHHLKHAPAGAICLDEVTAGLLDSRFVVQAAGGVLVLGGERPAEVARTVLGKRTPFVGRETEVAFALGLLAEALGRPAARAVLLLARPGAGKSRLVGELLARLPDALAGLPSVSSGAPRTVPSAAETGPVELVLGAGEPALVLSARGDPLGAGSPYGLIGAAIRREARIRGAEPLAVRQAKLLARVGRHLPVWAAGRVAALVGEVCGTPFPDDDGELLRAARADAVLLGDAVRGAWEEWLAAECAAHPVLLVLDDLQWGDLPSVRLVDHVLRNLRDAPLFVLAAARPEVRERFPELWAERDLHELHLAPLPRRAAQALVREVLGDRVDGPTARRLVERADGNPFFLEELMRQVAAGRGGTLPETVLGTVQARLDALGADARRVLRAASVFGPTFPAAGVAAILDDPDGDATAAHLAELSVRELVARRPGPGDALFDFAHELLSAAAYAMLPPRDRASAHRTAGEWLEWAGDSDAVRLAAHFEKGGELERAAAWYRRGAEQALTGNDLEAAIERAELGVALIPEGEPLGGLLLVKAEALRWRGELMAAERHAALAALRLIPGSVSWFQALGERADAAGLLGDPDGVEGCARAAVAEEPLPGAGPAQVVCLCRAAAQLYALGRPGAADPLLGLALGVAITVGVDGLGAARLARVAAGRAAAIGDPELPRLLERAARAARAAGDERDATLAEVDLAFACLERGELDRAAALLDTAQAAAAHLGLTQVVTWAGCARGRLHLERGERGAARAELEAVLAGGVEERDRRLAGAARLYLARAGLEEGAADEAELEGALAVELLGAAPARRAAAFATSALAAVAAGRPADARGYAARAGALLDELGHLEEGEALVDRARAAVHAALGDQAAADAALAAGVQRLRARADALPEGLREGFLARPDHVRLLDQA